MHFINKNVSAKLGKMFIWEKISDEILHNRGPYFVGIFFLHINRSSYFLNRITWNQKTVLQSVIKLLLAEVVP